MIVPRHPKNLGIPLKLLVLFMSALASIAGAVDTSNEYLVVDTEGLPTGYVLIGDSANTGWLNSEAIILGGSSQNNQFVTIQGAHYNTSALARLGLTLEAQPKPVDPTGANGPIPLVLDEPTLKNAIRIVGGVQGQAFLNFMDTAYSSTNTYGSFTFFTPSILNGLDRASVPTLDSGGFKIVFKIKDTANPWTVAGEVLQQFYQQEYDSIVVNVNASINDWINAYKQALDPGSDEANVALAFGQAVNDPSDIPAIRDIVNALTARQRRLAAEHISTLLSITSGANAGAAVVVNLVLWKQGMIDPIQAILAGLPAPIHGLVIRVVTAGGVKIFGYTAAIAKAFAKTAAAGISGLAAQSAKFIDAMLEATGKATVSALGKDELLATGTVCRDIFCFRGDQAVLTPGGLRPIGEIQPGDEVVSKDLDANSEVIGIVDHVSVGQCERFVAIAIRDDAGKDHTIIATPSHPIAVASFDRLRWIPAGSLDIGSRLCTQEGSARVDSVAWVGGGLCYNIIVRSVHDYYVGDALVLVHNGGCFTNQWRAFLALGNNGIFNFIYTFSENWQGFLNLTTSISESGLLEIDLQAYNLFKANSIFNKGVHEIIPRQTYKWIVTTFRNNADGPIAMQCFRAVDACRVPSKEIKFNKMVSASWPNVEMAVKNTGFSLADDGITKVPLGHTIGGTVVCTEFSGAYHKELFDNFTKSFAKGPSGTWKFNLATYKRLTDATNTKYFRDVGSDNRWTTVTDLYDTIVYPALISIFGN